MHQVIGESLDFASSWLATAAAGEPAPLFPSGVLV
jgi:hypothetical protein